ncbi:hypothetical protein TcYC6_0063790 [Trypanosoma cruzi]|nr:hypothetical protein TcYC6_0063790 [Trypanosoma cruzi]
MKPTPLRGRPGLPRNGEGHNDRATSAASHLWARGARTQSPRRGQKESIATRTAVNNGGGPTHAATTRRPAQASRRTSTRYFKLPDAIAEKGEGAFSPTEPDCGATVLRHPASGRRHEEGDQGGSGIVCDVGVGAEKVAGGRRTTLRRTRGQPNKEASRAAFSMATDDAAPPTRPQDARMPRSMSRMNRTPLGVAVLGLQKIAARSETKRTRPLKRKRRINLPAAGPNGSDGLHSDLRG